MDDGSHGRPAVAPLRYVLILTERRRTPAAHP